MPPLPFNLGVDMLLRRRVVAALFVAPSTLLLASFILFIQLENWVMASAGLSPHAPIWTHPNAAIVHPLMALAIAVLAVAGYLTGWLVNALGLVIFAKLSWFEACDAVLRSSVPASWLRTKARTLTEIAKLKEEFDHWSSERAVGLQRYLLTVCVCKFGLAFAAILLFARWLGRDPQLARTHWLAVLVLGILIGATVPLFFWYWREHRYLYRHRLLNEA